MGDLVLESFDEVDQLDQVGDSALGGLFEEFSDEEDDLVGGGIIDAGDDGGGIRELVLFEEAVESLLQNFFVGDGLGQQDECQDR